MRKVGHRRMRNKVTELVDSKDAISKRPTQKFWPLIVMLSLVITKHHPQDSREVNIPQRQNLKI